MQLIKPFLEKHNIVTEILAIGVSGGADSLALALMMKDELPNVHLVALTVDHGLRPTSRQEALYIAQVMEQYGIEHHILTWKGEKPQTGIEEQARIARYNLLCHWCQQHHIQYLAIAHHLYDQAETFLMRLERGSGLFGLSAMNEISERDGVKILRPLLNVSPTTMKEYLKKHHLDWVEDESNQCTDFLRVKMRQFLPTLQQEVGISPERLVMAAENLQSVRGFIEDTVQGIIRDDVHQWWKSGYSFDYNVFLSWHKELKFYIMSKLLLELNEQVYTPEADALKKLINQMVEKDFPGATLGGVYICLSDFRVWLIKEHRGEDLNISDDEWKVYRKQVPEVRGLKIPAKLKQVLIYEKKHKK